MGVERRWKFAIVTLETGLTIDRGLRADESQVRITQRHAVVGVPAAQHGAIHLSRDGAQRRAQPDGMGLVAHAQFLEAWQEPLQVLTTEQLKNKFFREARVTPVQNR